MTTRRPEPQSGMSALGLALTNTAAIGLLWIVLIGYSENHPLARAGEWDLGEE